MCCQADDFASSVTERVERLQTLANASDASVKTSAAVIPVLSNLMLESGHVKIRCLVSTYDIFFKSNEVSVEVVAEEEEDEEGKNAPALSEDVAAELLDSANVYFGGRPLIRQATSEDTVSKPHRLLANFATVMCILYRYFNTL